MNNNLDERDNSDFIRSVGAALNSAFIGFPTSIGTLFLGNGNNFDKNILRMRKYVREENDKKTIIAMKNIITGALNYINGRTIKLENNLPKKSSRNLINFNSTIEELLYDGADRKQLGELKTFLKESLKDIEDRNINLDDVEEVPAKKEEVPAKKEEESSGDEILRILSASIGGNPRGLGTDVNEKTKGPKISKKTKENERTEREILKDINQYAKDKETRESLETIVNDKIAYIKGENIYRGGVPISDSVEFTHMYRRFKGKIESFIAVNNDRSEKGKNETINFLERLKSELEKYNS